MPKPYPQESRDDVVRVAEAREEGVTLEQIAADFGIHPMTLQKWIRKADVEAGPLELGERSEQQEHQICSRILDTSSVGGPFMDEDHARTLRGDLTSDLLEVHRKGSSESVHRSDNQLVTVPEATDALGRLLPIGTRACGLLFNVDPVALPTASS